MEQLNKYYFIILNILIFNIATAQNDKKFFITKDTLLVENPVILSFKNFDGMFLTNENYLKHNKKINIKKMIDAGDAFIFSDDFYRFLSLKELQMNQTYKECVFLNKYNLSDKITIRKLDVSFIKFIVCFIRIDFYNKKIITQNNKKTYFPKKNDLDFYKIVFPICN
jgi:hypothetical protein